MASLVLDDFSGGLNLRDSPNQIALTESPNAYNWAITERGGLKRRNGHTNVVSLPGVAGTKAYIFYSAALDQWLCARETSGAPNTLKLFSRPGNLSSVWTDRGTINSVVSAAAGFVDFPGATPKVVLCTNVNSGAVKGIFTWDGTTLTDLAAGDLVCGDALSLWQNKVFVAGYPTSDANGNPTLLRWCDAGDPTTWTATNVQQFRELDAKPLTALGVAGGALVVFKKRSHYRVNDSSSGSFTTLDAAVGCVNARAVVPLRGRLFTWAADGIYECDGVGPADNVGDKLRPIYGDASTDTTTICGGVFEDHVIFAGTFGATSFAGVSGQIIDYSPSLRAAVLHTFASTSQNELTSFASKEAVLYAAIVDGDDLFSMFTATPGADDGSNFTAGWKTPWLLPNSGQLARLHRLRLQGLVATGFSGTMNVEVDKDWAAIGSGLSYDISTGLVAVGTEAQKAVDIQSLGHGYAFALAIAIGAGTGAASIRALQLIDQTLQWPNPGYPHPPHGVRTGRPTIKGPGGGPPYLPPPAP